MAPELNKFDLRTRMPLAKIDLDGNRCNTHEVHSHLLCYSHPTSTCNSMYKDISGSTNVLLHHAHNHTNFVSLEGPTILEVTSSVSLLHIQAVNLESTIPNVSSGIYIYIYILPRARGVHNMAGVDDCYNYSLHIILSVWLH